MGLDITHDEAILIVANWKREATRIRIVFTHENDRICLNATCTVSACDGFLSLTGTDDFRAIYSVGETGWHYSRTEELPTLARQQLGCTSAVDELPILGYRWPDGAMLVMYEGVLRPDGNQESEDA